MIYLMLFLAFFEIGLVAFGGGYAVLPFLEQIIVSEHGWLTTQEILDVVTISQMTPGPIAINAATFVGTKIAGLPGSIVATAGNVLPQFIIMLFLARLVFSDKKINFMENIIRGLRPGMVGLIFVATLSMMHGSFFDSAPLNQGLSSLFSQLSIPALVTFILGFYMHVKKVDIIKIIIMGAIVGLILPIGLSWLGIMI